jgi:hypothetical protein
VVSKSELLRVRLADDVVLTVSADHLNWVLVRERTRGELAKRPGTTLDIPLGYYSSLTAALRAFVDRSLRHTQVKDVTGLYAAITALHGQIGDMLQVPE